MKLTDHPWFAEEKARIGAIAPEAVFQERGQVLLAADVPAGDQSTVFRLLAIYDEEDNAVTGVRVYPLSPSFAEITRVLAPALEMTPDKVLALFPQDSRLNGMLPIDATTDGQTALSAAAAFLTVLQQKLDSGGARMLMDMVAAPRAWQAQLPPFGMRCFGRTVPRAVPGETDDNAAAVCI